MSWRTYVQMMVVFAAVGALAYFTHNDPILNTILTAGAGMLAHYVDAK